MERNFKNKTCKENTKVWLKISAFKNQEFWVLVQQFFPLPNYYFPYMMKYLKLLQIRTLS